jgi:peptidoglycan/LPS O-acetylase OafA/YrhL
MLPVDEPNQAPADGAEICREFQKFSILSIVRGTMNAKTPPGANPPLSTAFGAGRAHYQALDGLRGLAILLVFMVHAYGTADHFKASRLGSVLTFGAGCGWIGVDLFFVLSGFLITGILMDTLSGPGFFRSFYIRRTLRIFPLFYGVFFLLALLTPLLHLEWRLGHIAYLFYCQNIALAFDPKLLNVPPAVFLGPYWSLAVEEQYYMLWPLAIWLLRDQRKIMRLCLALIICCILLRFVVLRVAPNQAALYVVYWELPTHCDGLLLGSWLALAMRRWPVEVLWRRMQWLVWLAIAAFLCVGVYTRTLFFTTPAMETVGFAAIPVIFAGLLLRCFVPGSWELRIFSAPFLRFLGRYSYGMYVYHVLFWPIMIGWLHWLAGSLHSQTIGSLVYLLLWFWGTVTVAVLSYKFLESPFLRMKDRFAPYRNRPSVARPGDKSDPFPAEKALS